MILLIKIAISHYTINWSYINYKDLYWIWILLSQIMKNQIMLLASKSMFLD